MPEGWMMSCSRSPSSLLSPGWVIIFGRDGNNNQMENQRNSGPNPVLSQTSRQFYSRRIPQRSPSNAHLDKILKVLNQQPARKPASRVKTEQREDCATEEQGELTNMLKLARTKLENAIKRHPGAQEWRQLCDRFEQFKRSASLEVLRMNELNFLLKMEEVAKAAAPRAEDSPVDRLRARGSRGKEGKLSLEAIKLHKENQILKEQLDSLDHKPKTETLRSIHLARTATVDADEKRISEEEYAQLQREVEYLRQANAIFREQKRALQQKMNELRSSNQNLCEQVLKVRRSSSGHLQRLQSWRCIMAMQNEEIISLKRDLAEGRREFADLYRKYHSTIKRLTKLNNSNHHKLNEVTAKTVELFTEQIESFQRIRNAFSGRGYLGVAGGGREKELLSVPYKRFLGEKDSLSNPEGVKRMGKEYYRYYRPSFFVYLEKYFEYQGVDKDNFEQVNLNVGMHFLATLRAILDAKHNEHLINKHCSALPSFTVSWLCNFKIDAKTRRQQEINTDVCFQTIGSFYARLMSNQLNGNWEVITFREFLLETLTVDELSFYLKARFRLMKGDCLVGSGAFLEVCFVNYLDALLLIQEVVTDFDYRKKLEEYIKRSVQFQRKKQLVDAHFILRLLLEYYQYHKGKVFSTLAKTFSNFTRDKNTTMPFESYLKVFDYNFFEMDLVSKVEIFHKAYSLGRGTVNLENIFTILNQEGYLCAEVQKMFKKHVIFEQTEGEMICQRKPEELQMFQTFYQIFCDNNLTKEVSILGLQTIKIEANSLRISKNLTYESVFQRFEFIYNISMLNLKKLFQTKKLKQGEFIEMIPNHLKFYKKFVRLTVERSHILSILEDFRKKNAARAIMKFYRKKKGGFARSYLLSTENIDKLNKIEEIRKQFTNIIENIKLKYNNSTLHHTINEYDEID